MRGLGQNTKDNLKVLKFLHEWMVQDGISNANLAENMKVTRTSVTSWFTTDDIKLTRMAELAEVYKKAFIINLTNKDGKITDIMITSPQSLHENKVLKRFFDGLGYSIPEMAKLRKVSDQAMRDLISNSSVGLKKLQQIAELCGAKVVYRL